MKLKKFDDNSVCLMLSDRELIKYPSFKKENIIKDNGMARTVEEGTYDILVNDTSVEVKISLKNDNMRYIAEGTINNIPFFISKDREIRKYDIFREIVKNFEAIKNVS